MKNIYRFLLSVALFTCFSFSAEAQYRSHEPLESRVDRSDSRNRDARGRSNRNTRRTTTRRPPRALPARTEELDFQIYYTSMDVLLNMQIAIDAAQRAAVDRWLRRQEENFRKEINRQLRTRHSTFRNAQRDFFKNYEKNFKKVESRARSIGSSHSKKARSLDKEQEQHTNDLNLIEEWRHLRDVCSPRGIVNCDELSNKRVRNTRLGSTGLGTLDRLWDGSLNDFSKKEYGAAQNRSWAWGMHRIVDDGSLSTEMTNKHIANYNRKGLQDKVFLMTTYLTQYNNRGRGVMSVPITKYRLPNFWNNTILLNMGKKKAPKLTDSQRVFKDNFFQNESERCNSLSSNYSVRQCARNYERLEKLREDIILQHREAMLTRSEFGMTHKLNKLRKGYRKGNGSGKIGGLDALSYKNWTPDGNGSNANRFYQLNNGSWVYRSNSVREVNNGVSFSEPSLNDDGYFYYIFNDGTKRWHELLLPATGVSTTSDPYLVQAFWKGMKGVARYATPIEEAIVFIDGKDFDNNEASRAEAGVWLVVGFIPGGKILKPVIKGGGKAVKVAIKIGSKTIIQSATLIEGFITILKRQSIPSFRATTFLDGAYRTAKNNIDISLYRSFGGDALANGAFLTTKRGATRNELAILSEFNNSMRFEAKIKIPAGTTMNIGKVAPQVGKNGQRLSGGGDQVLLSSNWSINWITEILDNTTGKKYTLQEFRKLYPNLFN
ncbi:hypothetical protein [Spongiimicrobium sp. 2-473A-2-J]|uniref:hypothetical protein n=1 Tax=Eudoraea algarum TaxID=3417568 RepID=UPI003D36C2F8